MKALIIATILALGSVPVYAKIIAKSYIVATEDGTILQEQNGQEIRSIASISKLMAALISLDQDLNRKVQIPKRRTVSTTIPSNVRELTLKELLTLSLVRSDNFAAKVLCDNTENCVEKMNLKAKELGMHNTSFVEPTGLDRRNVSTAQDLVTLIRYSLGNSIISEISGQPNTVIQHQRGSFKVRNTNPFTRTHDVIMSKTGYTKRAGGCLVMVIKSHIGTRIVVLLGSRNTRTRISDSNQLLNND